MNKVLLPSHNQNKSKNFLTFFLEINSTSTAAGKQLRCQMRIFCFRKTLFISMNLEFYGSKNFCLFVFLTYFLMNKDFQFNMKFKLMTNFVSRFSSSKQLLSVKKEYLLIGMNNFRQSDTSRLASAKLLQMVHMCSDKVI
jgi:hypothetical protein